MDSGSGNSAYKVKSAREKVLINKINCRESVLEKQTSSKRCYSRFGFNLISGSVPSKKRECKMNGHGEFFLPFSSPKTAFLQVMDTNKKIITHRKRWRREDFSLCDELNWERRTFLQRKTPNWTAFSAIVCFVLLRYCIDIVYMVLDYYSKSKQTQSNTNTHCVLCVIKICVCVVWWNFWSCMAMELFYDRRIPRDCSVMNIWRIKQVKWSGKRQTWKRIWNASKSWKCPYGCLEIGNNVQSFLYQHCQKLYSCKNIYTRITYQNVFVPSYQTKSLMIPLKLIQPKENESLNVDGNS